MSELLAVFAQVAPQVVSEEKMAKMNPTSHVLSTDDLRLLQRLVRAEEQAAPAKSRRQRNAQRVARKLAAMRER